MSYDRHPWSERGDYAPEYRPAEPHTRFLREARLGDFFWAAVFLFFIALFALAAVADGIQLCIDIFRAGKSSKVTDHQMLWAVTAILGGPPLVGLCCWLIGRVVRAGSRMATARPDAIYIRRRW